ncbi:hypothetical protein F2Q69_00028363 [Brassica cretica]|uniref:RNase H type-1 domain-containing protein n=1 Tax=Brassica cretica TaxID=69181 RepID=A0A8S9S8H1_BRACR|nr:hypothetical protein F2Q69_00028363 [Brassica cretica]
MVNLKQTRIIFEFSSLSLQEALANPSSHPESRWLINAVHVLLQKLDSWCLRLTPSSENKAALEIATSVTRDLRIHSYVARNGPPWLRSLLNKEAATYNPPALDKAPVWTTISGIPFDLITPEGLRFICRPLGKAVDYKPFKSVTSAEIGHKKEICPSAPPSDPPKNKSAPKSKSEWTKVSHDKRKQDKVKETHKPPTPQVVLMAPVSVKGKEAVMEEAVSTNFSEPIPLDPQPSFSHLDLPRSEEILEEAQITLNQCMVGDGSTSKTTVSNSFAALCSEEAMIEDVEHSPLAMVIHNPKAHNSSVSPKRKRLKRQRASPSSHSSPATGGILLLHGGYRHSTNL